ncbi:RAB18, member RAS oncogene family isoform 2 [Planoprotostelium fungivorum]|uniref:RAB18, member RAS oncogene family isoform 2 n=1 Tax=Planoprotostelium fungivorum TaxID=1890364 RepID=A0A2P6N5K0_9EUKA|nr:RAB18, member RAS oncogene family isoform 2 [Planoprotostelium fungivorum]
MSESTESTEYDQIFKILMIGDSGVGKSSILLRFTDDDFEEDQPCTIGVDFKTKMVNLEGKRIALTIWDTAGQEKFRSLTSSYYRGAHGIIITYDVTNRLSFDCLAMWLKEVEVYIDKEPILLLVGNKVDKTDRKVSREEGAKFAEKHKMVFIEASAKTKLGIQQAFEELVQKILDTPSLWQNQPEKKQTKLTEDTENQSGGCC